MSMHLICSSVKGDNNAFSVKLVGRSNVIKHVRLVQPLACFMKMKCHENYGFRKKMLVTNHR